MPQSLPPDVASAIEHFPVGTCSDLQIIQMGLIHRTFRVETTEGTYCLQALHPKLATDEIMTDYQAVLTHLAAKNFPAPRLVPTTEEKPFFQSEDGVRWRMTTWLDGETFHTTDDLEQIRSAAEMLGHFHQTMADFQGPFYTKHPLHQTALHFEKMEQASQAFADDPCYAEVAELIEEVRGTLPYLFLPELPKRVVHGDPKFSNILFGSDGKAAAMIDLDTCNHHSILVDLGDAIRSWCRVGGEDQERPFSIERFTALIEGYTRKAPQLTRDEILRLPAAGRLITLELTARFLTDYLEDEYFGWDKENYPSRRAHNLARAKGMLFLAQSMLESQKNILQVVRQHFMPNPS